MTAASPRGRAVSAINMTPMIDVLLVLLIIFMVVQQGMQRGVSVQVPPPHATPHALGGDKNLVLEVLPGHVLRLNSQPIVPGQLVATLREVYAPRPRKVLFVKGDEGVAYQDVVAAVDASRAAGVEIVGFIPRSSAN